MYLWERALFYDQKLSINNSVSCASCHKQELAFADNVEFSTGFNGQLTTRNTPGIQNLDGGFIPLFWDGRQTNLNEMVLEPIMNHIEMGFDDMDQVRAKLEATNYYPALFKKEFGSHEITREKDWYCTCRFCVIDSDQSIFPLWTRIVQT